MQLEVGKTYRTRSGNNTTITDYILDDPFPFKAEDDKTYKSYLPNGREFNNWQTCDDLIEEVTVTMKLRKLDWKYNDQCQMINITAEVESSIDCATTTVPLHSTFEVLDAIDNLARTYDTIQSLEEVLEEEKQVIVNLITKGEDIVDLGRLIKLCHTSTWFF